MVKELAPTTPELLAAIGEQVTAIHTKDAEASFRARKKARDILDYTPGEHPKLREFHVTFRIGVRFGNPKTRRTEPRSLELTGEIVKLEIGDFGSSGKKLFVNLSFGKTNHNIQVELNLLNSRAAFYMVRDKRKEQITPVRDVALEDLKEFQKVLNILHPPQTQLGIGSKGQS